MFVDVVLKVEPTTESIDSPEEHSNEVFNLFSMFYNTHMHNINAARWLTVRLLTDRQWFALKDYSARSLR